MSLNTLEFKERFWKIENNEIVNDKVAISIYFNISLANSREKIRIKEKSNTTKLVFSIFKGFHDQLNLNKCQSQGPC